MPTVHLGVRWSLSCPSAISQSRQYFTPPHGHNAHALCTQADTGQTRRIRCHPSADVSQRYLFFFGSGHCCDDPTVAVDVTRSEDWLSLKPGVSERWQMCHNGMHKPISRRLCYKSHLPLFWGFVSFAFRTDLLFHGLLVHWAPLCMCLFALVRFKIPMFRRAPQFIAAPCRCFRLFDSNGSGWPQTMEQFTLFSTSKMTRPPNPKSRIHQPDHIPPGASAK